MSVVRTLIGNIKGPQGATGATGATGPQGDAATVNVGSVSTTAYGNAAQVTNVGTENDAILNFVIPQGKPGEKTTTMSGLTLDTVTTSADEFPVPAVSENGSTVWGKVIKFFQDTVAALTGKLDANKIVNSQAVTEAGYGLDALQANPSVSGSLAAQISDLNDSLTNLATPTIGNVAKYASSTPINISSGWVFKFGNVVFFQVSITPTAAILSNTNILVFTWTAKSRCDFIIKDLSESSVSGAYIGASSNVLMNNGAILTNGRPYTTFGFYIVN